jgi:hypothetical protein
MAKGLQAGARYLRTDGARIAELEAERDAAREDLRLTEERAVRAEQQIQRMTTGEILRPREGHGPGYGAEVAEMILGSEHLRVQGEARRLREQVASCRKALRGACHRLSRVERMDENSKTESSSPEEWMDDIAHIEGVPLADLTGEEGSA